MTMKRLGPYRIERLLGRGGMGAVYAGVDAETGERAAIKVLAEALGSDPRFRERFQGEVESLKRLRHKNIVTLKGYGEEEGQLYFVMELVDGQNLEAERTAGRRFSWEEVADIATQVCAALKHAHDHGVIHRDLKPANLILTADGTVKLTDFGIAKLFGSASLTLAGSMIGTPNFMSPEQTEGKPVTPRSDLYSLGCVMYALLAGQPPFQADSVTAVIDRVRFQTAKPVQYFAPETPDEMAAIIEQLLCKKPEDRIATPQLLSNRLLALKHALSASAAAEPTGIAPPGSESTTVPGTQYGNGKDALPRPASAADRSPTAFTADKADLAGIEPTEVSVQQFPPGDAKETVEYTAEEELKLAEIPASETRFTAVSEEDWRSTVDRSAASRDRRRERLAAVTIGAALLAVVGLTIYLLLPPSADQLYEQIRSLADEANRANRYERCLDEFLQRFPDDPRAEEVQRRRRDVHCVRLREELNNKLRALTEFERLYLEGMRLVEQRKWEEAQPCFEQIVDAHRGKILSPADRRLVDRSQHMLETTQQATPR
jgi:serine/threonine-protein kinase